MTTGYLPPAPPSLAARPRLPLFTTVLNVGNVPSASNASWANAYRCVMFGALGGLAVTRTTPGASLSLRERAPSGAHGRRVLTARRVQTSPEGPVGQPGAWGRGTVAPERSSSVWRP